MLKRLYLKYFSQLLLLVVLTIALNGVHESAHALSCDFSTPTAQASIGETPAQQKSTPTPAHEDQDDCGKCAACLSCACHAPLPVAPLLLSYNPLVVEFTTSEPFQHLPEVYLSKFIPPQLKA